MGQTLSCLRTPTAANEVPRRHLERRPVDAAELRRPATRRNTTATRDDPSFRDPKARSASSAVLAADARGKRRSESALRDSASAGSTRPDPRSDRADPPRLVSDLAGPDRAPEPAWRADVKRRTEAVKRASSPVRRESSSLDSVALLSSRRLSSPVTRSGASSVGGSAGSDGVHQRTRRSGGIGGRPTQTRPGAAASIKTCDRPKRHSSVEARGTGAREAKIASDRVLPQAKRHSNVETRTAGGRGGGSSGKLQDWTKRHSSNMEAQVSGEREGGVAKQRVRRHSAMGNDAPVGGEKGLGDRERGEAMQENKAVTGHGPLHGRRRVHFDEVGARGIAWRRGHEPKDSLDELEMKVEAEANAEGEDQDVDLDDAPKSIVQLGIERFTDKSGRTALPSTKTIVTRQPSRIEGDEDGPVSLTKTA